jgi:thiol-disulfide isomerase/thioredoxin
MFFTSCDEGKTDESKISSQEMVKKIHNIKQSTTKKIVPRRYHLTFISLDKEPTLLNIKKNIYDFSNIQEPIVLVNFFATWCPPCRGQIAHLNNLQKKYQSRLFVMGLLLHDDINSKEVTECIALKRVDYYISDSKKSNQKFAEIIAPQLGLKSNFELPMMVMFVYGEYYTHYEGTVPEEMIESDIKQALKEIEG